MKGIRTVFFAICLVLLNVSVVIAQSMPPPAGPPATPNDDPVPINDHIVLLLVSAIVLGVIMIYKNKIKKASM